MFQPSKFSPPQKVTQTEGEKDLKTPKGLKKIAEGVYLLIDNVPQPKKDDG